MRSSAAVRMDGGLAFPADGIADCQLVYAAAASATTVRTVATCLAQKLMAPFLVAFCIKSKESLISAVHGTGLARGGVPGAFLF